MLHDNLSSTASAAGHALHAMLVPISIACFVKTVISDPRLVADDIGGAVRRVNAAQ